MGTSRLTSVCAALLAVLGVFLAAACGGAEQARSSELGLPEATESSYQDERFDWTATVPPGFVVTVMEEQSRVFTRLVVVSSFELGPGRLYERLGPFPADGVAFALDYSSGGVVSIPTPEPETPFPIDLSSFLPDGTLDGDPPTATLSRLVEANGEQFQAHAWIGAEASATLREALSRLIASLQFPSLEIGTLTESGFFVLQPAATFAPQSVTRFETDDLPLGGWADSLEGFYLVNAPGGFYALAWPGEFAQSGLSDCDVQYGARAFACADTGVRWDIVGRVLKNPAPRRLRDDPLGFKIVKTSHDGKVMLLLTTTEYPSEHHLRRYWPAGSWQGPVPPRPGRILVLDQRTPATSHSHFHFTLHGISRVDFGESQGQARGRGMVLFDDRYPPGVYRIEIVYRNHKRTLASCAVTVKLRSGETVIVRGRRGSLGPISPCAVRYRG